MLKQFFSAPWTLQRLQSGPLGPHLDAFAGGLVKRGYTRRSIRDRLRWVRELSEWLEAHGFAVEDVDEARIADFVTEVSRGRESTWRYHAAAVMVLGHLRDNGILPTPPREVVDTPLRRLEDDYVRHSVEERGLARTTVKRRLPLIRSFLLDRFGTGPLALVELCPVDVTRFVLTYSRTRGRSGSPRNAQILLVALRSFFRFLRLRGDIRLDLAAAVPRVASWRHAGLPKSLPSEQIHQLLDSCDRSRPAGQRDYALLLLLARLGLRASEVRTMRLEDLDWRAGEILVRGKGRRLERLPLPQDVGEALVAYLRWGRPRCCATRKLFVHARAPYRGLEHSSSVAGIVRRALERAGLDPPLKGAHLLRHSLATDMLRRGASLGEIGLILRHRQPATTEIYAKVDFEALRTLAQPWPGGTP